MYFENIKITFFIKTNPTLKGHAFAFGFYLIHGKGLFLPPAFSFFRFQILGMAG